MYKFILTASFSRTKFTKIRNHLIFNKHQIKIYSSIIPSSSRQLPLNITLESADSLKDGNQLSDIPKSLLEYTKTSEKDFDFSDSQ